MTVIEIAIQGILQACILVTIMGNDYRKCIFIVRVEGERGAGEQGGRGVLRGERGQRAGRMLWAVGGGAGSG